MISRTLALSSLLAASAAAETGGQVVCRANDDMVLSYTGGVDGFRPNENFIREWRREPPNAIITAPRYIEGLRFNGDDAELTYDYTVDDRSKTATDPADDHVHAIDGKTRAGARAYVQTYWERDDKTLMAHIACNDAGSPAGDCRIGFEDARRIGRGSADGPVVDLFLRDGKPHDVCITSMGERGPWWLEFDGVKSPVIESPCAGLDIAEVFAKATTIKAVTPSTFEHNKGQELVNTLTGEGVAAARSLSDYVRALSYAPSPERKAALDQLVAQSKAAFAANSETIRQCTNREPPT